MSTFLRTLSIMALLAGSAIAGAQQLDAHFSCSAVQQKDGDTVTYADNGEMRIDRDRIAAFRWESALYRSTHGFDCSIDESDNLLAEVLDEAQKVTWRVSLQDAHAARERRGFDFDRGLNCTIRLVHEGDMLHVVPSCPALCGSRGNFTELSVNMKSGECRYEE